MDTSENITTPMVQPQKMQKPFLTLSLLQTLFLTLEKNGIGLDKFFPHSVQIGLILILTYTIDKIKYKVFSYKRGSSLENL